MRRKRDRDKYIIWDELKRLAKVIHSDRDLLIIMLAANLGLRIGEVVRLRVKDIDFKNKLIHVPCLKRGKGRIKRGQLPDTYEMLPLPDNLSKMLKNYIEKYDIKGFLFTGYDGQHITERRVQDIFKKYRDEAGLRRVYTFHCLRHFRGNMIYEKTHDIKAVQILLRHKNINSSAIYVSLSDKAKKELAERIGEVKV